MLTQKDPFAVLFSESKKHNPLVQNQETKKTTQEQNATRLKVCEQTLSWLAKAGPESFKKFGKF